MNGRISTNVAALFVFGVLPLILFARREGLRFRANIQWGPQKALSSLLPGAAAIGAAAVYLWRWADSGVVPVSDGLVVGVVMLTLSVLFAGVGALKSTQHRAALAFRKMLASGREFFIAELAKERPALRDEWFPWVLAFGLGKQMDDWSAQRASERSRRRVPAAGAHPQARLAPARAAPHPARGQVLPAAALVAAVVALRGRRRRLVWPHRSRRRVRAVRAGDRAARAVAAAADLQAAAVVVAGNYSLLILNAQIFRTSLRELVSDIQFKTYQAPFNSDTFFWTSFKPCQRFVYAGGLAVLPHPVASMCRATLSILITNFASRSGARLLRSARVGDRTRSDDRAVRQR